MTAQQTKILDSLLSAGAISKEQHQGILNHFKARGGTIEEACIEIGALDEDTLLKALARIHRTRFVTTEKLRKADIPREVLELVPLKLVAKHNIFPIMLDKKTGELAIVTSNPNDLAVEQEIAQAAGVPRVRSFVARPASVKAAIGKFYKGDIHAFAQLDKESYQAFHQMMDVYERNLLDEATLAASLVEEGNQRERVLSAEQMEEGAVRAKKSKEAPDVQQVSIEMLKILVSLLESTRGDLAGHSVQAAHFAEKMCRRIGMPDKDIAAATMAALLHDLGKGSPYHLTPFNVAEWDGHRTAAEKRFENPERLFQSAGLPENTRIALHHMYERFDGQGLPNGLRGKDIPLGARILAMSDTFSDLTANPRNPYRRTLTTEEAMQVLDKAKNKVFDSNLVDLFGAVVAGDDLKRQLLTGAQTVLVVDADPEQSAILDLQLMSRGFKVRTVRTADQAIKALSEVRANIIVSEVDLEPFDGFELKKRLNTSDQTREIPFIYFSSRAGSTDVEQGFALGAQDFLVKPSRIDVVAAKIHKLLGEKPGAAGGVSGSLKEMSLPDLVQILAHGRKSGQLKLGIGNHRGEIHFVQGEIYNALFDDLRGEEAFFEMLRFKEGTFVLNPAFRAESREIQMTAEMLLLEGMRRFDEDNR